MAVREALEQDADAVAKVLLESYNIQSLEEGKAVFLSELRKEHHYVVLEDDGKIIGIASWTVHDLPKHELAEMNRIAVLKEVRGKGAAQELFQGLLEDIKAFYISRGKRLRKLYCLTHASNIRARKFYEKLGFHHEAEMKDHYYQGENECVYSMFF